MKRLVTILVIIALVPQLSAGWIKLYGMHGKGYAEIGYGVVQSADAGYMVVGEAGQYRTDTWLLKTDSLGDTLLTRTFVLGRTSTSYCIKAVQEGGYVIAGVEVSNNVPAEEQLVLLRIDTNGDTLWTRTYGGEQNDRGYWVCTTSDGGYAATGIAEWNMFDQLPRKLFLVRTDSDGDIMWTRTYGGELDDWGMCVEQTPDGGFIVTGYSNSLGLYEDADMWLVKTDSLGDTLWTRTFGGENDDGGDGLIVTNDGGYLIVGITDLTAMMAPISGDVWLVKTDSAGNLEWEKKYGITGGGFVDMAYGVEQTTDGGYIVVGSTGSLGAIGNDVWLLKTDSLGDTLWTRRFGGERAEYGRCVHQTQDGGYIVTGYTNSYSEEVTDYDVLLIKTDSLGYVSIEESSSVFLPPSWDIASPVTSVGGSVVLRYSNYPQGFRASIYDATGRKVSSIESRASSGSISWGMGYSPGVYIIREEQGTKAKVVLVK